MIKSNFTVLSAELSTLSDSENVTRSLLLRDMLTDLNLEFLEAKGFYKGSEEISFIVSTPDVISFNAVADFAFKQFNQESVLYVDGNSVAYLMYGINFQTEKLGTFSKVNPKRLEDLEAYTIVNGDLYTVL